MGHDPGQIPPAALPVDGRGMIGNMKTAALVSLSGAIDFMCFPRIDSPTVFAALLDRERGGAFRSRRASRTRTSSRCICPKRTCCSRAS